LRRVFGGETQPARTVGFAPVMRPSEPLPSEGDLAEERCLFRYRSKRWASVEGAGGVDA
jgi:hypothetical protein